MFAFLDETGNTGANLLDPAQPDFFTAALITKSDFDLVYSNRINRICKSNGVNSIHASELGFGRIENIAPDIIKVLKDANAHFFISRVEKRYLLATKIFDTFFDSGENPAVPFHVYNVKSLKLIMCFKIASIVSEATGKLFWDMLMAPNERRARSMLPDICTQLLSQVSRIPDQRSRDIVTDALVWSRDHPEALDIFVDRRQAKNNHMPNMVAFSNLLNGLENYSKKWNRPVRRILHDRQSQFEKSLKEWHELLSTGSDEPVHWFGEAYVWQKVAGSTFDISAADESAGIQIADLVLWIYKQYINGRSIPNNSARLLRHVFKRGYHSDFSFDGVGKHVSDQIEQFNLIDLDEEASNQIGALLSKIEARRKTLLDRYEVDGLMPYERK